MSIISLVNDPARRMALASRLLAGAALFIAADALAADPAATSPAATNAVSAFDEATPDDADVPVGEVSVTVRRRKESVQDVPIALSALSGADLDARGIERYQDVQFEVPDTTVNLSNPRQAIVTIRGIGANPAADGLAGSTGIYIDGIYLDREGMAAVDLTDIAQFDVLRGPQGTLFGKNTTAGALNITTNKPTFTPEGDFEVTVGSRATEEEKATVNGPVVDDVLAGRLSLYDDRHGAYVNSTNGGDFNDLYRYGFRGQLLYTPSSNLSVLLRADAEIENDHSGYSILYSPGPAVSQNSKYLTFAQWTKNTGVPQVIDPDAYATNSNVPQQLYTQGNGVSAEVNYQFGGGYTLTSLTGARGWEFRPENNNIYANVPAAWLPYQYSSQVIEHDKQASEELRVASPTDGPIDYVVGTYYFWRRMDASQQISYPFDWSKVVGTASYLNGALTRWDGDPTTNSVAAFGQANWHLTNQWTVTGGLRETYEANNTLLERFPVAGGPGGVPASLGPYNGSISIANWTGAELLTTSYKVDDNVMTYVSLNHGAKAGGFNSPAVPTYDTIAKAYLPAYSLVVYPEVAYTAEIGAKSTLWNNLVTLNGDLFFERFFHYQANETTRLSDGTFVNNLLNVGSVTSKGIEEDITLRPFKGLTITNSGSYDLAYYDSFANAVSVAGSAASTQNLSGAGILGAPHWSDSSNVTYTHALANDIDGYLGAEYNFRSKQYGSADDASYGVIKSFGLANFRIGARYTQKYDLSLWINNAFNKAWFYNVSSPGIAGLDYSAAPGEPRVFGATLRVKL